MNSAEEPTHSTTGRWGWDLAKQQAVRWDERGPGEQVMGPYPSREAAERWREQVERRNDTWDDADEDWNSWPDES